MCVALEIQEGDGPVQSVPLASYSEGYPRYLALRADARKKTAKDGIPRNVRIVVELERFDTAPPKPPPKQAHPLLCWP